MSNSDPSGGMPVCSWQPPPPHELQAGFPAYGLIALIGRGGMGAVYQARQLSLDRLVAIKVLAPEIDGETEMHREQFTNEARALGRLSHPAIIGVHEFGITPQGLYFLCMEYFQGITLYEKIRQDGRLTGAKVLPLIISVCDALHYAHAHGVVHGDIKPENILINREGHVRVADFGLARLEDIHGNRRREVTMGTPEYVAPEVYNKEAVIDGRADIFSLGIVLHHMLTGAPLRAERVPASRLVQCDPRFDPIILKATEHDPERRYATGGEMKAALERLATALRAPVAVRAAPGPQATHAAPAVPRSPAAIERKPEPKNRTKALLAGAGVAAIVIAAIAAISLQGKPAVNQPVATNSASATTPTNPFGDLDITAPQKAPTASASTKPAPARPTAGTPAKVPIPEKAGPVVAGSASRYQFRPGGFSWEEARKDAEAAGGMLACITSREEFDFLVQKVLIPSAFQRGTAWLGAQASRENEWKWLSGEPFSAEGMWQPNQPSIGRKASSGDFPAFLSIGKPESGWGFNDLSDSASGTSHWRHGNVGYILELPLEPPTVATAPKVEPPAVPAMTAPPLALQITGGEAVKSLTAAEENFRAALEKEVLAGWKKAAAELDATYLAGLERALDSATRAGKLEEALIFEQEKKRHIAKEEFPSGDDPALPPSLQALRKNHREKTAKLQQDRDRKVKPLYDKYLAWVSGRVTDFTRQKKLEEARYAREHQERIAAEIATSTVSVAATAQSADPALIKPFRRPEPVPVPPEATAPSAPPVNTRKLAEWALSCSGGSVTMTIDGKWKELTNANKDKVPAGDFKLLNLISGGAPRSGFDPMWLEGENLKKLDLWGPLITRPVVLRSNSGIKWLRFSARDLKQADILQFPPLPALTELWLSGGDLSPVAVQIIAERTPAVKVAELRGLETSGCVSMCALWPGLEHLGLDQVKCSPADERALAAYPSLRYLRLQNTDFNIKALKACRTLTRISFDGKRYRDSDLKDALSLPQVKSVTVINADCSDDCFTGLATRTGLTTVHFEKCPLKGRRLDLLKSQTELTRLGLGYTELDDAGLLKLPALPALAQLLLPHSEKLTDASVPAITRQKALTKLDLSGCLGLSPSGLSAILDGLPALEWLDTTSNQVDASVLSAIARHSALKYADLGHTEIKATDAITLLAAAKALTTVVVPKRFTEAEVKALRAAKKGLTVTQ